MNPAKAYALIGSLMGMALGLGGREAAAAGKCEGDSARFHILPAEIGKPGQTALVPYAFPCDSMVVPAGKKTTIHGSTLAHFGTGSPSGKITVKGDLVIEGKPSQPAYLSGSLTTTEFGPVPGNQAWGGLEVDSGASLRMSHARLFNASTALVLFSKNVVLEDCYFRGTSGLVLPDTSLFLDPKGQTLDRLDLRNGKPAVLARKENRESQAQGKSGKDAPALSKRAVWITAGTAGILAVSGAGWLAWNMHSEGNGPRNPGGTDLDPDPALPPVPAPAGR